MNPEKRGPDRIFAVYAIEKVGKSNETPRFLHDTFVKPSAVTIGAPLDQGSNMIVMDVDKKSRPRVIICSPE